MKNIWHSLLALKNFDSFLIASGSIILILIYTGHSGIGISPDSIVYLSVARNMNAHGVPVDFNLKPLVDFPVGYPFFLSMTSFFFRPGQLAGAAYLNAILFAGLIMITGWLIDSFERTGKIYKRTILLFIALSPALLDVYSMLWSETLFILLLVLFILVFSRYLKEHSVSCLLLCAVIAGIACITRYAGITIIAAGLLLLVFDRSLHWRKRIVHSIIFGCSSGFLLGANLLHNFLIAGLPTGPRESGITPLYVNLYYFGSIICQWLAIPARHPVVVSGTVLILFFAVVALFIRRSWLSHTYASPAHCFTAFFIVYTVFIIGISTLSHFEQINNRLLSPLFIPLLITLTAWIPKTRKRMNIKQQQLTGVLWLLIAINFQFSQFSRLTEMYREASNYGIPGYTDDSWKASAIAKFLRQRPVVFNKKYLIYANADEAAYFNGNLRSESLPHLSSKKDIQSFFSKDGEYLIWFNQIEDTELISLKMIREHADLFKECDFKDGAIYFIKPRHSQAKPHHS